MIEDAQAVILLPSLPVHTVIYSKTRAEEWTKFAEGKWGETNYHCLDCMEEVHEAGAESTGYGMATTTEKAEDYLGDFDIVAAPLGFQPTYVRVLNVSEVVKNEIDLKYANVPDAKDRKEKYDAE